MAADRKSVAIIIGATITIKILLLYRCHYIDVSEKNYKFHFVRILFSTDISLDQAILQKFISSINAIYFKNMHFPKLFRTNAFHASLCNSLIKQSFMFLVFFIPLSLE